MLHLASYNIQYGVGKDGQVDLDRIVAELGASDLVALQEVERNNRRSGYRDQPLEIARRFPGFHWVFGPAVDLYTPPRPGTDDDPTARRWQYGNMVLSRWPILSVTNHTLPRLALSGIPHQQRTLVECVIETAEGPLRLCSVHLDHVSPQTRMPQVELMGALAADGPARGPGWGGVAPDWADMAPPPMPRDVVVMGDMNFAPDGPEYAALIGDRVPRHGRTVRADGLADAFVAAGHGEAPAPTFFAGAESRKIDHCFLSTPMAHAVRDARIDAEAQGSDHQPIFVDLDLASHAVRA